jgi:FdhE protein
MSASFQVASTDADATALRALESERPELGPWLRPLGIALDAAAREPWRSLVPRCQTIHESAAPRLHHAIVPLDPLAARAHLHAIASVVPNAAPLHDALDVFALLEAAVANDDDAIARLAAEAHIEAGKLAVVAQLTTFTLLQACARSLGFDPIPNWNLGYCPICGAQPALAEVLGLERRRCLRCARCGATWNARVLLCAFCGERDHEKLGSLVPDGRAGQLAWIETCRTCNGYLKVRAALRSASAAGVLVDDVRSVELDLAAQERGVQRPQLGRFSVRLRLAHNSAHA